MHFVIAVPLDSGLASFIGKKGSENSITFYNRIYNDNVVVALMPSSIEEKVYGLAQSLLIANQIIISSSNVDKNFGEVIVAAGLVNKKVIFTGENEVDEFAKSAGITSYEICSREELLDKITNFKQDQVFAASEKRVDIDKSFVVKGIGCVLLGIVTRGSIAMHDTLKHSNGKEVFIRSIQSQDRDVEKADIFTRVGIAVKGLDAEEVEKGDILANNVISYKKSLNAKIKVSGIAKEELKEGSSYGFAINFSYTTAIVGHVGSEIELKLEKPVPFEKGDSFFLIRQKQPRLFAAGTVL
ncbi:MAG: hypothetical protein ACP5RT_00970 [Candidatus Micrarchaeia archaeon]